MNKIFLTKFKLIIGLMALIFIFVTGSLALAATDAAAETNTAPAVEIAPGEFLPIAVKLTNFGGKKEMDVLVNYEIQDADGKVFFRSSETVPVETTVSFVKNILLPITLPAGQYFAFSKINYSDQTEPSVSKFEFKVNRKIAGLFLDQLAIYCLVIIFVGGGFYVLSRALVGRRQRRLKQLDYTEVAKADRPFYEMISDLIADARKRHGERAVELAAEIDGLVLDEEAGRVLNLSKDPAEIIALLILKYERAYKKKVKFTPRKKTAETKKKLKAIEDNLAIARKYFE